MLTPAAWTYWVRSATIAAIALAAIAVDAQRSAVSASESDGIKPEGINFFEQRIRPVLTAHCLECHSQSSKPLKGKLRLDTAAAARMGGASGPAIVPGKPSDSLLLAALDHDGSFVDMPPKGKLPPAVIADFRRWIEMGAPDPRTEQPDQASAKSIRAMAPDEARKHWGFQPIRKPTPPNVALTSWPKTPVDAFILARLESAGLKPSPPANPRTLVRRLFLDLIGLPPTAEEVDAFVAECERATGPQNQSAYYPSGAAIERVVDRLLASPQYGERWARHWLDVARYADTKDGVLMYGDARIRPHAFTYRDYVIRAFNEDTPYDRFVTEQLAGDLIEPKLKPERLAAMGFLTLGRMFDLNAHDVIDDQIDTMSRGLLGLTVSCARCHDHKYDAISTKDYYSLYGVFARSEQPIELPAIGQPDRKAPGFTDFDKKDKTSRQALTQLLDDQYVLLSEFERTHAGDYLFDIATVKPDPLENAIFFRSLVPGELRPLTLARWRQYVQKCSRDDAVFGPWHELFAMAKTEPAEPDRLDRAAPQKLDKPDPGIAAGAATVLDRLAKLRRGRQVGEINPVVFDALRSNSIRTRGDIARAYRQAFTGAYDSFRRNAATPAERQLVELLTSTSGPAFFPKNSTWHYMSRAEKDRFHGLKTELDILAAKFPHAQPRAMSLVDCASPMAEPRVFVRGNATVLGETVNRRFISVLTNGAPRPFGPGSGRLELAKAIVDPRNPLTARVFVNRIWMHHMGEPLVATPSDFGARGTPPTHPELLDWLAACFIENGWSIKQLHRDIVLSRVYQQASVDRTDCRAVDPDNRLYWRANRSRMDFETMRDSMLAVAGRIDRTPFGRPTDIAVDSNNRRRTVYALVDRQSLPTMFRAFDFANPDQSMDRRPFTTVPQQALFALNAPFVAVQADALAASIAASASTDPVQAVETLYRKIFARRPSNEELNLAMKFLETTPKTSVAIAKATGLDLPPSASAGAKSTVSTTPSPNPPLTRWSQYSQMLLVSNEFLFCD